MRAMTFSSCSPCIRLPRWPDCRNRPKLPTWLNDVHLPECTERPLCGKHTATLNGRSWPGAARNGRYLEARAAGQIGVFNTSKFGGPRQPTVTTLCCHPPTAASGEPNYCIEG